jgi:protein-disulfide isomerase
MKGNIYIDLNRIKEIFKKLNIKAPISKIEKIAKQSSNEVARQKAFAKEIGVRATPTILLNGRIVSGGHNSQFINKLIDSIKTGKKK